jgi:hypothetical protein
LRIAVLKDDSLPGNPWAAALPDALQDLGAAVELVGTDHVAAGKLDVEYFCCGPGGVYPSAIEDGLYDFLAMGGGLLHFGATPFSRPLHKESGVWRDHLRTLGDIREHRGHGPLDTAVDVFPARLGLASYHMDLGDNESEYHHRFDARLFPDAPKLAPFPTAGIACNSSVPIATVRPDLRLVDHRAYQARPLSRVSHEAGTVCGPDGRTLGISLLLTKFFRNPFSSTTAPPRPWAIFAGEPSGELPGELLSGMLRWLSCPVFLSEPVVDLAALRKGEKTDVEIRLSDMLPSGWAVVAQTAAFERPELLGHSDPQWTVIKHDVQRDGKAIALEVPHREDALVHGFQVQLRDEKGAVRDWVSSGVACVRASDMERGPLIQPDGRYLSVSVPGQRQRSTFIIGTNWQDRQQFAFTWHNPNALRVGADAMAMADAGMIAVRPHFFHPEWFRETAADVYGSAFPEVYAEFSDGPALSDRHLRAFEAHLALFSAAGLALMPTLYTSVGMSMGNPGHWIGTERLFVLPDLIKNQLVFAEQVMREFGQFRGLIWDLDNEPDTALHDAGPWAERQRTVWAATGHSVGVGVSRMRESVLLGESADWHSVHGNLGPVVNKPAEFGTGKPCLFQEAHNPAPATEQGDIEQEVNLERALGWTVRYGGAGLLPWNWSMGAMNWRYDGGWVDYWDYELGTAVHSDGTPRRGLSTLQNWSRLLNGLEFDQTLDEQVVFVYPKRFLADRGASEYLDLLARRDVRVRGINDADLEKAELRHARLMIFPHAAVGYRESSFRRMRDFAASGGCVWAHNDTMVCDEVGCLTTDRKVPPVGGREECGEGFIHWCQGWNIDTNPLDATVPVDLVPFVSLVQELGLRATGPSLPLLDGAIQFDEHWSNTETAMTSAWSPRAALPPQAIVSGLRVTKPDGTVRRAWSDGSSSLTIQGYKLGSLDGSIFAVADSTDALYITGRRITLDPALAQREIELVRPFPNWEALPLRDHRVKMQPGSSIDLSGWRSQYWVRLTR